MNNKNKTIDSGNKFRLSIVNKLSSRLFFRLFGIFLSIDILICLFAGTSMIIYSERLASLSAEVILETGIPDETSNEWLRLSGVSIKNIVTEPDGFNPPGFVSWLLPELTEAGTRRLEQTNEINALFLNYFEGISYIVEIENLGSTYEISIELSTFIIIFIYAFLSLLVIELIILISRAIKDNRMVRRTLEPISELAKTAQNLNVIGSQFEPDKMAALAGKLEGINAARLDTRIPIEDTQEELKNLAGAINGMLDRINESYRAQVRFVSDASHELRTPISVIQGYANLLDRWGKNDEKTLQESINAIKDEAANMKDLIEQLLFLARGDNNTIALNNEMFVLSELADEVIHETQLIDSAHQYNTRLSNVVVYADKALIKQALRILIDNAIKYTDSGGTITVSTSLEGESAKLSVQDDGIGISPEVIPRIFDRFYRADESRTRATGGAGLGLSIAKWITSRHGGQMEVLSREQIGTRITILLPAAKTEIAPSDDRPKDNI